MPRTRVNAWLVASAFALAAALVYVFNPSETASLDPRLRILGFSVFRMPSHSMTPTLKPGDLMLVSAYPYFRSGPEVGDLLVYYTTPGGLPYVKRVVAQGGDTVRIEGGVVMRNDAALDEPYVDAESRVRPYSQEYAVVHIGENQLWSLGDNRDNSIDSRRTGPVDRASVIGKVVFVW